MPTIQFNLAPQQPTKPKVKPIPKPKPTSPRSRRVEALDVAFGSSLFEDFYSRENLVYITFRDFTKDLIKISRCGRFGIKHFKSKEEDDGIIERWELFYFKTPIIWDFNLEYEAILHNKEDVEVFTYECGKNCRETCSIMEGKVVELATKDFVEREGKTLIENADEIFSKIDKIGDNSNVERETRIIPTEPTSSPTLELPSLLNSEEGEAQPKEENEIEEGEGGEKVQGIEDREEQQGRGEEIKKITNLWEGI